MKRILIGLGFVLAIVFSLLYVSKYNYLLTGVSTIYFTGHTTAYLTDYKKFPNNSVIASAQPQAWPLHKFYNQYSTSKTLEDYHEDRKTVTYLVIKTTVFFMKNITTVMDQTPKATPFRSPKVSFLP